MNKKVIILDLDNTIYPVSSIGEKLFKGLFEAIKNSGEFEGAFDAVKLEIQRSPFQKVAKNFKFSTKLLKQCMLIHCNLTYEYPMQVFDDYSDVQKLPHKKYLVTSGFTKLQNSKVKQLGIINDFEKTYIIDLQVSTTTTKKEIFQKILAENNYSKKEVLIIGDDLNSEIKAGNELGMETVLYDKNNAFSDLENQNSISSFQQLKQFI